MAIYCQGCRVDIDAWPITYKHFIGSADANTAGYVFCTSCWNGVEDYFYNTGIDKAMFYLCSAMSGTKDAATTNDSAITQWVQYKTIGASGITPA